MTRREEILQHAIECGCIEGTAEYYGFLQGAEWADAHQPSPWISVEDRMPEKINKFMSEPVLCRYTRGNKEYYHVSQYDYEFDKWQISNVTHWMPIPKLIV